MTWFTFALIGAVCFTLYSLVIRMYLADHGDALVFALLANITVGALLVTFATFDQVTADLSPARIALAGLSSVLYAAASALIIWGRQLEQVSIAAVTKQSTTVWVFAGGILVLGEGFSALKLLGVAVIVAGTLLAIWERGHLRWSKGIMILLVGSLLGSAAALIDKTMVEQYVSPALYAGVVSLLAALWLYIVLPNSTARMRSELRLQTWRLGVVGILLALSVLMLMKGFQHGEASRVVPVYEVSVILAVLAGIVVLQERDRIPYKLGGAAVAFAGVVLLRLM